MIVYITVVSLVKFRGMSVSSGVRKEGHSIPLGGTVPLLPLVPMPMMFMQTMACFIYQTMQQALSTGTIGYGLYHETKGTIGCKSPLKPML